MRLRHLSGRVVHLSCEIAPHPARRLPALLGGLDAYGAARALIGVDVLGVSPWLPPALAAALASGGRARTRLRAELEARGLEVHTLSGLSLDEEAGSPFGGGGGEIPGWDDAARRDYTLDLARILVDLLPDEAVRGAIWTVGLGRRAGWDEEAVTSAADMLRRLSTRLADLAWSNGRAVRVAFQPHDGFALDAPGDAVSEMAHVDKDRLGVRLDLDDAVARWPDPAAALDTIVGAGLSIIDVRLTADITDAHRDVLARVIGSQGPLTEFFTLGARTGEVVAERTADDVAYVVEELAALGLTPENAPCPAR
jgi:sugar phosphate isomerase/epimerase